MAIKPISFNAEMVRAILDGKKTCTRRLVEPQPDEKHAYPLGFVIHSTKKKDVGCFGFGIDEYGSSIEHVKPPYQYQPGDILYVQEPWERFECQNCEGYEGEIAQTNRKQAHLIKLVVAICIRQQMKYTEMQSDIRLSACQEKRHVSGLRLQI